MVIVVYRDLLLDLLVFSIHLNYILFRLREVFLNIGDTGCLMRWVPIDFYKI